MPVLVAELGRGRTDGAIGRLTGKRWYLGISVETGCTTIARHKMLYLFRLEGEVWTYL